MAAPHPRSPFEQLGPDFVRIHCAGIVRALASVLDCLAGAIVGVAAVWLLRVAPNRYKWVRNSVCAHHRYGICSGECGPEQLRTPAESSRIMERFDQRSVSFVSMTRQFNTTTALGRLTLNILLSFAHFEREITGERTRDKLAAARRKGKWIGGTPPLGYDVAPEGGRLTINDAFPTAPTNMHSPCETRIKRARRPKNSLPAKEDSCSGRA